jgi:hypothetical protein
MPDLIRHPEGVENTGFRLKDCRNDRYTNIVYGQTLFKGIFTVYLRRLKMEDFRKLSNGLLEIQILKEQTEALNTHKKIALEELGTIVYTNISQGLSEEKKVKDMCDLMKAIDNQIKEKEEELLRISDRIKESILGLKPIPPCDCGTDLYEGMKFCYQCGKKVVENVKGEGEKEEKKGAIDRVCSQCGNQLPKELPFCPHCGIYTEILDH